MKESPIFTRTYDLLRWLVPATVKLPRQHRFVLAEMLQRTAFRFQEEILEAGYCNRPVAELARADLTLAKLKLYLRLCHDDNFNNNLGFRLVLSIAGFCFKAIELGYRRRAGRECRKAVAMEGQAAFTSL